jgi:hypothetical protein
LMEMKNLLPSKMRSIVVLKIIVIIYMEFYFWHSFSHNFSLSYSHRKWNDINFNYEFKKSLAHNPIFHLL